MNLGNIIDPERVWSVRVPERKANEFECSMPAPRVVTHLHDDDPDPRYGDEEPRVKPVRRAAGKKMRHSGIVSRIRAALFRLDRGGDLKQLRAVLPGITPLQLRTNLGYLVHARKVVRSGLHGASVYRLRK
jgi:hypothetical protein